MNPSFPQHKSEASSRGPVAAAAPPDFLGRTALSLLAALPSGARVLFLMDRAHALLNVGRVAEAQFVSVPIDGAHRLPFRQESFACVVLDTSLVGTSGATPGDGGCAAVVAEAQRVLTPNGELVMSTRARRAAPKLKVFGRLNADDGRWEETAQRSGFEIQELYLAHADGLRLTELTPAGNLTPKAAGRSRTPAFQILRCARKGRLAGRSVLDSILDRVRSGLPGGWSQALKSERFAIRKIGKTAITLTAATGAKYIVRIPRSRIASERAHRNFAALQALQDNSTLPPWVRSAAPRAVLAGTAGDYAFFVEEHLAGTEPPPAAWRGADGVWQPDAVDFITSLHLATARPAVIDTDRAERVIRSPIRQIRAGCEPRWADGVLDWLQHLIESRLLYRSIPFMWTHGDYFLGNCLYNAAGRLTGVVDWELFSRDGLPLLDLLHCMRIAGETSSHRKWQRFSAVYEMLHSPQRVGQSPILSAYLQSMKIPTAVVPALLAMYWVDHVACRIVARSADVAWMSKRVYGPLREFAEMQRGSSLRVLGD